MHVVPSPSTATDAGMTRAPGLQQVERLGASHLADQDTIGAQAQRRADEVGERGGRP
jgi:hypothetical protein